MPGLDQNVETHPNGSIGASEKLLKVPAQQTNGKIAEDEVEDDVIPTADVVVPIDGGWGWVIVFASFLCCVVVDGVVMGAADPLAKALKVYFKDASASEVIQIIFNYLLFLWS